MWDAILRFLQWHQITAAGIDATVYFCLASVATVLFVIRLLMMLLGSELHGDLDAGGDVEVDTGVDVHADVDHGGSFHLFSLLSILAFLMGLGWMGLTARMTWELGSSVSLLVAAGTGVAFDLLAASMMYYLKRLEKVVVVDIKTCKGKIGQVYLTIPGHHEGAGQVEVTVGGRRQIISARTAGDKIAAFTAVKIVDVTDDDVLIVEPG